MSQQLAVKDNKELEAKMAMVFGERMEVLSMEMQEILLDDMVTAFENRLIVLKRAEVKG